jgi:putative membrane protein
MGHFGYGGFGWIGMLLGLVISIAMLVGLVLLVVWAVRRIGSTSTNHSTPASGSLSAKDIAQARYAKGEINREEYQQIISDLSK